MSKSDDEPHWHFVECLRHSLLHLTEGLNDAEVLGWILDTNAAFLLISLAPIALRLDSKVSKSVSSRRGITVHYVGHVLDFEFNIKTLK